MRIFLILIFGLSIIGCADSFSNPYPMPIINLDLIDKKPSSSKEFYIQEFEDKRTNKTLVNYKDISFSSDAEVGPAVRESLSHALVAEGYQYSKNANLVLKIHILKWHAEVSGDLISSVNAEAELELSIFNRQGQITYKGRYLGRANLHHLSLNNEDANMTLAMAMKEAILNLSADKKMAQLFTSFTN